MKTKAVLSIFVATLMVAFEMQSSALAASIGLLTYEVDVDGDIDFQVDTLTDPTAKLFCSKNESDPIPITNGSIVHIESFSNPSAEFFFTLDTDSGPVDKATLQVYEPFDAGVYDTFYNTAVFRYNSGDFSIQAGACNNSSSNVPIPAPAFLLCTGLTGLIALRRRLLSRAQ